MKLREKEKETELKCPKCGGNIKHRLEREDGYIVDCFGNKTTCYLHCDDYICEKCKTEFTKEDS